MPDAPTDIDGATEPASFASVPSPRQTLRSARRLSALANRITSRERPLYDAIRRAYVDVRAEAVRRELAKIPVGRLRDTTEGRLRIGPLEDAGLTTVGHIHRLTHAELDRLPGMGEKSAKQAVAAAAQVAAAVADSVRVRVVLDPDDAVSTALLRPLHRLVEVDRAAPAARRHARQMHTDLATVLAVARPARSQLWMTFARKARRAEAITALATVERWLIWAKSNAVGEGLSAADRLLRRRLARPRAVWSDFEQHSADYYGVLAEVVDRGLDVAASEGFLSDDIVARVRAQPLDERFRRVALRGYQSFGARFALVQRRVIIGDEMGLGKTIQAIAVLAHLRAGDDRYFLVVCPASVLINWVREIESRSHLRVHRLHGPDRETNLKTWLRDGDVAVTTIDSLHDLDVPAGLRVAALVVDEAHYAKNPDARRSIAVRAWTDRADRVLFLTGTPMENRVDEFKSLVGYLQPRVLPAISGTDAVAGADAFRRAVAPVYLRRNQEDVLTELPELTRTDEWVEFTGPDFQAYRNAVAAGNFMAMRRAAYLTADVRTSAKLARLVELVGEAAENGRKVIVFSYFRDVLDTVRTTLGAAAYGPLTGSVPPPARQKMVDEFSAARGHAVLISQIQAGGVGLNIQAASVIIICEPQVKPTTEDQAVARSHRMGQVRTVAVHRLLTSDSVDERMLEILQTKSHLFDEYARQSHLADASPDALDMTDAALARQVVAMEQQRLALRD
jgi:superfamily II DNA or RNA helicase